MDSYKKDEPKATAAVIDTSLAPDEGLQEPEQKSVAGLPVKKVQKLNKELTKQNTQLVKSVDTLKKQKEELLSDRQKLKSENKTLERELKRVSSKGEIQRFSKKSSQISIGDILDMSTTEELAEKVQRLETLLAEKDKKLRRIRERLEKLNVDLPRIYPLSDSDTASSRESTAIPELPQNGGLVQLESSMLDEDYNRLQLENTELRNKMAALESNLEQLQLQINQREVADSSSKPHTRRKSGNFFKRGKIQSKSLVMKSSEDVQKEREVVKEKERQRSKSPDFFTVSDSYRLTSESTQNDFTAAGSLPNFSVSGLSPRTAAKRAHGDIQTLQSCLKLAIDEKKSLGEQNKQIERELVAAKEKITELQTLAERMPAVTKEVESLKNSLRIAATEKTSLSKQLSEFEKSCEKVKSKNTLLEKQLDETIEKKDLEIANLNEKIRKLQKDLSESEDVFLASKKQSPAPPTPVTPSVSALDENKRKRSISARLPPSPSRQVKQVTNQNAIVENKTRKTSQPKLSRGSSSSSLSADEHYDSVANTRAMFEQKIGHSNADITSPKRSGRKVSWTGERRSSYSSASPGSKPNVSHAKSSSFDATSAVQSTTETNKATLAENKSGEQSSAPAQTSKGALTENSKNVHQSSAPLSSSKHSLGNSCKVQQKPVSSTSTSPPAVKTTNMSFHKHQARYNEANKTQTCTSSGNESAPNSVPKVTKITVKPHSTSPVTSSPRKNQVEQTSVQTVQKQTSVSSPLTKSSGLESSSPSVSKHVSSTSSKTAVYNRSMSVGNKREFPIKIPTVSNSSVKRTTITPVRSTTVAQFSSVKVANTTPSPNSSGTTITPVRSNTVAQFGSAKATNTTPSPSSSGMTITPVRSNTVAQFGSAKAANTTPSPSSYMTTITPVRSNTVAQFGSVKVTDTTPSPSSSATVKITTTSSSPQMQRANQQQQPQSNVGIQSTLSVPGSIKKASSLQDIPEQVTSESGSQSSVTSTTPVSPVRQSPVALRAQRRGRSERPKTMYAGKAETTNLVNLISRFQQQESAKNENSKVSFSIGKGSPSSKTAVVNGFSSPQSSQVILRSTVAKTPVSSTSSVITRQSNTRAPRPNSYYGDPSAK